MEVEKLINNEKKIFFSLNEYVKYLEIISGINFTNREIDVAACVLSGRSSKKIASVLSISVNTVNTHIQKIASKIGCSTRDHIIEFFEKSDKFIYIKKHYEQLLSIIKFKNELKAINSSIIKNHINVLILHSESQLNKNTFIYHLEKFLQMAGVKVVQQVWNKTSSKNLNREKVTNENIQGVIYVFDKKFFSLLNKINYNIDDELLDVSAALKESIRPCICVCCNDKPSEENALCFSQNKLSNLHYVDINKQENFYFFIFEILKKLPITNINKHILNFTEYSKALKTGGSLDKFLQKQNKERTSSGQNKKFNFMKKTIIFCSLFLIFLGGYFFTFNNELKVNNNVQKLDKKQVLTFNLPYLIDHYIPRNQITNTIWENFNTYGKRKTLLFAGLYGLGGIGKTTLAADAIHNPKRPYKFKAWFNAENKKLLKANYFELGSKFHLFVDNMSDKLKIKIVKDWLDNNESVLLVYDNVPNMETIKEYLPSKGHIIITSRNFKIPGAVAVDVMFKKEAQNLMNTLIPLEIKQMHNYNEQVNELIEVLGYLPLALSQAASYINKNIISISDYLKLYKTNKKELLSENSLPFGDGHEPIYVTWDISIKAIQHSVYAKDVLKLLEFISYCHAENIPRKLLMQYLYGEISNEKKIKLNHILSLLRQYSFVKLTTNTVSIHRLVSDWIKIKYTKTNKIEIFKNSVAAIKAIYPKEDKIFANKSFLTNLIPHCEKILSEHKSLNANTQIKDLCDILGKSYYTLGDDNKSEKFFEKALYAINQINSEDKNKKSISILHNLGKTYLNLGRHEKAKHTLKKALKFAKIHGSYDDHNTTFKILNDLAKAYNYLGDYQKGMKMSEQALKNVEKKLGPYHVENIEILDTLGYSCFIFGDYHKTKSITERALKISRKHYSKNHIKMAIALKHRGEVHCVFGEYAEGKKLLEEALDITKAYFGTNHIQTGLMLNTYGIAHLYIGNFEKAKYLFEQSMQIAEKYFGPNHLSKAIYLKNLCFTYVFLGEHSKAISLLEQSIKMKQEKFGHKHISTLKSLYVLAFAYLHLGDYTKTEKILMQINNLALESYGTEHSFMASIYSFHGNLYRILGDLNKSKEFLEKSLNYFKNAYGDSNINTAIVQANLGLLYGDVGDFKNEKKYLEHALIVFKKNLSSDHEYISSTVKELKKMKRKSKINNKSNMFRPKALGYVIII